MSPILKIIYTLFLGLMLALFIGMGIEAFYPSPKAPEYPSSIKFEEQVQTTEDKIAIQQYESDQKAFQEKFSIYNRNVFIIALIGSITILIISLTLTNFLKDLADGVLLGGVFTLFYSIIRAIMSENSQFRFLAVTVGLIIALVLGYLKLSKPKHKEVQ